MNCKNCNAVMRIDQERKVFVCPYCDSVEPFDGVSKAELQGMLQEAIQDVRKESMKEARERMEREAVMQKTRSAGNRAADVAIFVAQIVLCIFFLLFTIGLFIDFVGVGIVSLLQLILMVSAMILKAKYRKTGVKKWLKLKNGCLIGVGILVIIWFVALMAGDSSSSGSSHDDSWPTQGFGSELPVPNGTIRYAYSSKNDFSATIKGFSTSAFNAYVEECRESGFNIDEEVLENRFVAYDENDNELVLSLWSHSKELNIQFSKGIVMAEYQWPTGELAERIPQPAAEKSCLVRLNSTGFQIYVGDLTRQQFVQYIMELQEKGFEGYYNGDSDDYYGRKDRLTVSLKFKRGRLLFIDAYESK